MKKVVMVTGLLGVMGLGGIIAIAGNNDAAADSVNNSSYSELESSNFQNKSGVTLESSNFVNNSVAQLESSSFSNNSVSKSSNKTSGQTKLSVEEIEKKALEHVKNGVITDLEYERDGKWRYYEVEVLTKEAEYELILDAITGKLLDKEVDRHDDEDDYYEELYDNDYDDDRYDD